MFPHLLYQYYKSLNSSEKNCSPDSLVSMDLFIFIQQRHQQRHSFLGLWLLHEKIEHPSLQKLSEIPLWGNPVTGARCKQCSCFDVNCFQNIIRLFSKCLPYSGITNLIPSQSKYWRIFKNHVRFCQVFTELGKVPLVNL